MIIFNSVETESQIILEQLYELLIDVLLESEDKGGKFDNDN